MTTSMSKRTVRVITSLSLAALMGCQVKVAPGVRRSPDRPSASSTPSPSPVQSRALSVLPSVAMRGVIRMDPSYLLGGNLARLRTDTSERALVLSSGGLVGNDSASLVGNDSASLVGNDSASLVGNDSASLVGNDSASLVGNDSASLVGNDSASLVGVGGAKVLGAAPGDAAVVEGPRQFAGVAFRLAQAAAEADSDDVPVAGMIVQLLDLGTGAPVRMVDSAGRVGNAVLSDAQGNYEVFLPENKAGTVMVRASVPGRLKDPRARLGLLTSGSTKASRDVDAESSLVTFYCRRVLRRHFLELISQDNSELGAGSVVQNTFKTRVPLVVTAFQQARFQLRSTEERGLVAQALSDFVLGQIGDLQTVPIPDLGAVEPGMDTSLPVLLKFIGGEPVTGSVKASEEMAAVLNQIHEIAARKLQEKYEFDNNVVLKSLFAALSDYRARPKEQQPDWLPDGELAILQPSDLADLIVRAYFFSNDDELEQIKVMDRIDRETMATLGVPRRYLTDKSPKGQFIGLMVTLGKTEQESEAMYARLHFAAISILGAILKELFTNPDPLVAEVGRFSTAEGLAQLKRSATARF